MLIINKTMNTQSWISKIRIKIRQFRVVLYKKFLHTKVKVSSFHRDVTDD